MKNAEAKHRAGLRQHVGRLVSGAAQLRHDPRGARYALSFVRSLRPGRSPLDDELPWLTFSAIAWLRAHLRPDMHVFEYGSGGSTLFFSRRAAVVVSVEHDRAWHADVARRLEAARLTNCTYLLREPEAAHDEEYGSTDPAYRGLSFGAYVQTIDSYPDRSFDLVAVDGRARPACLRRAVAKVKPRGYLLLDDSNRESYAAAVAELARFPRRDFAGIAPYKTDVGQTSVWAIET